MNGRNWKQLFVFMATIVVTIGCGAGASSADPPPTVDPVQAMQAAIQATMAAEQGNRGEQVAAWLAELEEAEARWIANPGLLLLIFGWIQWLCSVLL